MKELVPDDDPITGLGDFYDFLWGEQSGYVYLPYKNRDLPDKDPKSWTKVMFDWPADRSKIIEYTLATSAQGRDVYVAPAIFTERRPLKENTKGSYVLWVDFDGNAPKEWPDSDVPVPGPSVAADGSQPLPAAAPSPTLRISSSKPGHVHTYWRLDEFCTDVKFVEEVNRSLAYMYKADTGGWDINQVLRPPYTTNYKRDLPVTIEATTDRTYSNEAFSGFRRVKQIVADNIDITNLPSVERIIARYPWDEHHADLFFKKEIEEGKRSSALMSLGYFGAESQMTDKEIYVLLLNADDRWGKFKGRVNREKYLLDIINKARQKHPIGESLELRGLLGSADDVQEAPRYVFGFEEFNQLDIKLEWLIEGLLERQGMGLIASAPGVGKTQWSLQFAIHCALGADFLIWKIPKPMKVLWFSLEMIAPALQYFTKQMAAHYSAEEMALLEENLLIVPLGEVLPLDNDQGKKFLEALLEEYSPDGIVLDSMGKVTNKSLNDEEMAKKLNAYYGFLRKKYDIFVWFIHHNRKANGDNKKPKELSDIYGNQYISADLTSAVSLWKDDDGIELNVIKSRLAAEVKPVPLIRTETLRFIIDDDNFYTESPLINETSVEKKEVSNGSTGRPPADVSRNSIFDLG